MTNVRSRNAFLSIAGATALASVASACTAGVLVDENFNSITDSRTGNASVTFQALGSNNLPNGTDYQFNLGGQPYVSFDAWAANGATTTNYPGLVNNSLYIPPGNYRVEFFQPQVGFAYSPPFAHAYTSGTCTDEFTGSSDSACQIYWFELNYNCTFCTAPTCGGGTIQPLGTHDGFPVINMCVAF